jgi:hypothetical protein
MQIKRTLNILLAAVLLAASSSVGAQTLAEPSWSFTYNLASTPEANGFTRTLSGSPAVTTQTTGPAANRRVEINSTNGSCVFLTSSVPSLDPNVGATAEATVSVTGAGDAGFELTFLDRHIGIQVYMDKITVTTPDGLPDHEFPTVSNATDTVVRLTYSPDGTARVYRNGVLLATLAIPSTPHSFQRVLWWGEGGGVQIVRSLKFFIGGPVA